MCSRFTLTRIESLAELFQLAGLLHLEPLTLEPRFNVAPSQLVAAVRYDIEKGTKELAELRWGLIPSWADDPKIGYKLINARAESVAQKPAFRAAFKKRRCLIPADGYFEWQKQGSKKQPYYFRRQDGKPFAFAGLWERWDKSPAGQPPLESCTIITTEANALTQPIHDRMPVILQPNDYATWLDPALQDPAVLVPLLRPLAGDELTFYPVSTRVNSPKNDEPACVVPLA
jgi:putative SOS response-associated peptidase YedK